MKNDRGIGRASLDATDHKLLAAITDNARISLADLGRFLGMSPQSAADRLRRLEDVGVVAGFTAVLDLRPSACRSAPISCAPGDG